MTTFQKKTRQPIVFLKYCVSVLMMVFALTTSVKSNTTIIIAADTTADDNKLYMQAEIPPAFPGGSDKFSGFLQENKRYPDAMRKAIVTGKVNVQSIVERRYGVYQTYCGHSGYRPRG